MDMVIVALTSVLIIVLCLITRFLQFEFSSYETSPEIYSLEDKVNYSTVYIPDIHSVTLRN